MEKEKTYTTTEVMEMCGLTRAAVLSRARPLGFTKCCKYVLKRTSWGNYIKEFSFTESQVKAMGCDHKVCSETVEEVIEKTREEELEELKKEHPLVKDERCFTLSWFPDTKPKNFEEI